MLTLILQSSAYLDLMEAYQWTTITILYQVPKSLTRYALQSTRCTWHSFASQDNDSMMTLKEIFGKTSTIGPMEVNKE